MARYFNGDKPQPHPIQSATSTAGCDRAALSPAAAAACVLCASSDLPCRKMAADDPGGASAPPLARRHQALVFLRLAPAALVTLLRVMPPVLSRDDLSHVPAELLPSHLLRWRALGAMAHGRQFRIIPRNTSAVVSLPLLAGYLEAWGRL